MAFGFAFKMSLYSGQFISKPRAQFFHFLSQILVGGLVIRVDFVLLHFHLRDLALLACARKTTVLAHACLKETNIYIYKMKRYPETNY